MMIYKHILTPQFKTLEGLHWQLSYSCWNKGKEKERGKLESENSKEKKSVRECWLKLQRCMKLIADEFGFCAMGQVLQLVVGAKEKAPSNSNFDLLF